MGKKYVFVNDEEFLDRGNFKNPINTFDHKLENYYPNYHTVSYDLRIIAHKLPQYPKTQEYEELKKEFPALFYDPYLEVGTPNLDLIKEICKTRKIKSIFLNGFAQEHLEEIILYIKDSIEIIYFFKCNLINDLSVLEDCPKLECVHIDWNNKLKSLWNMDKNIQFKVLSCLFITKLENIDDLKNSSLEYITLNGQSESGYKVACLFEYQNVFNKIPELKHLTLNFKILDVDY